MRHRKLRNNTTRSGSKSAAAIPLLGVLGVSLLLSGARPSRAAESEALEEIIVTATKREVRLQDVPLAISALSGKALQELGAADFLGYARTIPGLSFTDLGAGRQKPTIRGVSVTTGSAAVTYYIGETPIPESTGTLRLATVNPKLVDIDRIEVLRGPQGTLYGASSLGGTIKYVPAAPDFNDTVGRLSLGASNTLNGGSGFDTDATLNVPLAENLALRGSVWYRDADGFISRRLIADLAGAVQPTLSDTKRNIPNERTEGARAILRYQPLPSVDLSAMVLYQQQDWGGFQDITVGATNLGKGLYQDLLLPVDEPSSNRSTLYNLTANIDLGNFKLTSSSSYYQGRLTATEEAVAVIDRFFGGAPFNNRLEEGVTSNTTTQELRLATIKPMAGFDFIIGGFYNKLDGSRYVFWSPPGWNETFAPGGPTDPSGNYSANNDLFTSRSRPEQKEKSAFGELTYHLTDALDVTGGIRHYTIDGSSLTRVSGLFNGGETTTATESKSSGNVYKLNVSFKPLSDKLLYAQYSEGFRPGFGLGSLPTTCDAELAARGITGNIRQVDPDRTKNYEIGAKTTWSGGLLVNVAAYRIDWDDIQQSLFLDCGLSLIRNAGAARNQGLELEMQARLAGVLDVGGSVSYIDSKLLKDAPEFGASKGDRIADVPKIQGSLFASLPFKAPSQWDGRLRVDFQYVGNTLTDFKKVAGAPDPLSNRAPLTLLNARLTLERVPWRVEISGDNLLNDIELMSRAESLVLAIPNRPRMIVNRPRTLGVGVAYSF